MTRYAAQTSVSSDKSRAEIERLLLRYGADQFMYGLLPEAAMIAFRARGRHVRFLLPNIWNTAEDALAALRENPCS